MVNQQRRRGWAWATVIVAGAVLMWKRPEALVALVQAAAWPVTVVTLAHLFAEDLRRVLRRRIRGRIGDKEFEIDAEQFVEQNAEEAQRLVEPAGREQREASAVD